MTRSYDIELVATTGDTNMVGNVYFATFLRWQGMCRELCLAEHAPKYLQELDGEITALTESASCTYRDELWVGDRVSIRMTIPWIRLHLMPLRFEYYRLTDDGEQLVATGEQMIACMRKHGRSFSPGPWPPEMLALGSHLGADIHRAFTE
ncbi:acyl-CoA thioesterase [Streptomyces noursei]|uniref:acyl-CoA thioesterase n=1 Tax=Streptomyces noursei TaxID=1971 RepID=UPI00167A8215|nr:thioesterase family protein [Streptomyces noursei]MCZ1021052.1 thioesterase family protein [Streptomyces noursei]GGX54724.1 4-hydroxybenzoyl-CoA thioesterase [Streptomyces noursei]